MLYFHYYERESMAEIEDETDVILDNIQGKHKRPRLSQTFDIQSDLSLLQSIQKRLPYVASLPNKWQKDMESKLFQRYFDPTVRPNVFVFISIIKVTGTHYYAAIETLRDAGAFSSAKSRQVLLDIIQDARNADTYRIDCSDDLLDLLERYAQRAFSIEEDCQTVGCGSLVL